MVSSPQAGRTLYPTFIQHPPASGTSCSGTATTFSTPIASAPSERLSTTRRRIAHLNAGSYMSPRASATTVEELARRWLPSGSKRESSRERDRSIVNKHLVPAGVEADPGHRTGHPRRLPGAGGRLGQRRPVAPDGGADRRLAALDVPIRPRRRAHLPQPRRPPEAAAHRHRRAPEAHQRLPRAPRRRPRPAAGRVHVVRRCPRAALGRDRRAHPRCRRHRPRHRVGP